MRQAPLEHSSADVLSAGKVETGDDGPAPSLPCSLSAVHLPGDPPAGGDGGLVSHLDGGGGGRGGGTVDAGVKLKAGQVSLGPKAGARRKRGGIVVKVLLRANI